MQRTAKCSRLPPSLLAAVVLLVTTALSGSLEARTGVPQPRLQDTYGTLPLSFEANQGQTEAPVQFLARGDGYQLFLTASEAVLVFHPRHPPAFAPGWGGRGRGRGRESEPTAPPNPQLPPSPSDRPVLRMQLVGASPAAALVGVAPLAGKVHYFLGHDPARWRPHLPTYAQVKAAAVYPGVDVLYYGAQGRLEFDFLVAPGADPGVIRLAFAGEGGAPGRPLLQREGQGDLVVQTAGGEVRLHKPVIYQEVGGSRRAVPGRYVWLPRSPGEGQGERRPQVGFEVGAYDVARALVIDPVLVYSTYLGGQRDDVGNGIAVDATGHIYVTGHTRSLDFPTEKPWQPGYGGGSIFGDAFVAKLTPDGSALVYATYLGGSKDEQGTGIAVDPAGNASVVGWTHSANFPVAKPLQPALRGLMDAFVAKLSSDGSALLYSTYLGGSATDGGSGIAVDAAGQAYVTGGTSSIDFPTVKAWQPVRRGPADAFVAKLSSDGSAFLYSTYLGGSGGEGARAIAVDAAGNAYITGPTDSHDFPTVNPVQPTPGGRSDAFVAKLSSDGSALVYATYLGGSASDDSQSIAVDAAGQAYVTGYTGSPDFPTLKAWQPAHGGGEWDAFVAKLTPDGSALVYATYLGGSDDDSGEGIAADAGGFAYVTGFTRSRDFPTAKPWQLEPGGGLRDVVVTKLTPTGSALVYSTYLGGTSNDFGLGIAVDGAGSVYLTGGTWGGDFPLRNPLQPRYGGLDDAFVAKLSHVPEPEIAVEPLVVRFGAVRLGKSRTRGVWIQNQGDAELVVSALAGVEAPFALVGPPPPFTVAPGERVKVRVRFTPTQPGKVRGTIVVSSNDADEPEVVVSLTGQGKTRSNGTLASPLEVTR